MNSFGVLFRVSLFGESHGSDTGVIIDGCPPGIALDPEDFIPDLTRRKSGARGTTSRKESDMPEFISGVYQGYTTGSPLAIITRNKDKISSDYSLFDNIPRPGHADFVAGMKYSGFSDLRGSGHFSGRITWGMVVAGVVAKKIYGRKNITAKLLSAGGSEDIEDAINRAIADNDSVGGIIECVVKDPPLGLGEPFFYSFESALSHIVFSIPAVKGIEFGSGFASASMRGSVHNDPFTDAAGKTASNHAGGINGGITNGNDIVFRVAVKPTSSIGKEQFTYNFQAEEMQKLKIKGRHDTCIALRMPVIIEAAAAITMVDLLLVNRGIYGIDKSGKTDS
ncbi:MAG: chorismate synthase [Bacteroidetes bacterium]|jgi:chorismate synthase|nr:chorismate synthase [Bacteroidota bacterium]